jgi:uncharacterized protein YecE (DUF72 family)
MNKAHIGTMGWSYNFWIGNFYPLGTKSERFLEEYSKHFDTVEIDNTFYRIPSRSSIMKWRNATPPGFIFSAKFPQIVTHVKMLRSCETEVKIFIERMAAFQGKLGPLLLQFPPKFGIKDLPVIQDFLPTLPRKRRFAVEVRNKTLLVDKVYSLLRENGVALVLLDSPTIPQIEELTADFAYIRWEGDRKKIVGTMGKLDTDRGEDLDRWGNKIRVLLDRSMEVFGYFSKYFSGLPPSDVEYLLKSL